MVKPFLFLFVIVALAVLLLSNLAPVSLTILGIKTLALPLGIWIVGAIAAGAFTTVIISGLFSLSRPASSGRRPKRSTSSRSSSSPRAPWANWNNPQAAASTQTSSSKESAYSSSSSRRGGDDWGSGESKEEWEDWSNDQEPTDRQFQPQTQVRDTEDDDWANWEGYEDLGRKPHSDEFEDVEDFETDRGDRTVNRDMPPRRTDFEVQREPESHRQTGSVYSYSYRKETEPEPAPPAKKPGEVYDAEYRVLTPPYRPDPEEVEMPAAETPTSSEFDPDFDDDEDWGLDDEPATPTDRPR